MENIDFFSSNANINITKVTRRQPGLQCTFPKGKKETGAEEGAKMKQMNNQLQHMENKLV